MALCLGRSAHAILGQHSGKGIHFVRTHTSLLDLIVNVGSILRNQIVGLAVIIVIAVCSEIEAMASTYRRQA